MSIGTAPFPNPANPAAPAAPAALFPNPANDSLFAQKIKSFQQARVTKIRNFCIGVHTFSKTPQMEPNFGPNAFWTHSCARNLHLPELRFCLFTGKTRDLCASQLRSGPKKSSVRSGMAPNLILTKGNAALCWDSLRAPRQPRSNPHRIRSNTIHTEGSHGSPLT